MKPWRAQNRRFSLCPVPHALATHYFLRLTRARGGCFLSGRKALLNDFWYFSSSKSTIKEKFLYDSSRANDVRPYSIESKLCQHPKQKIRLLIRFFFCIYRRKRKSYEKENAEIEISRSAEHDKGSAPLNAPPFEKGGRKLYDDEIFYFLP